MTVLEEFESRWIAEPNSGCWLWVGAGERYGHFWFEGRPQGAHRVAWILYRGPIPFGLLVLHRCDVMRCVNPGHLFLGTQLVNRRDAVMKGRVARGERVGNAILTDEIVSSIRERAALGDGATVIARALGLKRVTVSAVTTGRNWR